MPDRPESYQQMPLPSALRPPPGFVKLHRRKRTGARKHPSQDSPQHSSHHTPALGFDRQPGASLPGLGSVRARVLAAPRVFAKSRSSLFHIVSTRESLRSCGSGRIPASRLSPGLAPGGRQRAGKKQGTGLRAVIHRLCKVAPGFPPGHTGTPPQLVPSPPPTPRIGLSPGCAPVI